jgi:hypothetical protein
MRQTNPVPILIWLDSKKKTSALGDDPFVT